MLLAKTLGRLASTLSPSSRSSSISRVATRTLIAATTKSQQPDNISQQQNLITIKDSCLRRLKQILERPEEEFLRINVETGGCSGFSYEFQIEQKDGIDPSEDLIFERENYKLVINKHILPFMKGSEIEFEESLIKSSFQVKNPLADTKCSCGSSFSVNMNKLSSN